MLDGTEKYVVTDNEFIISVTDTRPDERDGGAYDRTIDCRGRLMLPGFYNAHSHAAMTLFRGYGEDMPLDRWLNEKIFPAEDRLTSEAVYTASLFACAEMIKNGIVSFSDMYFFCDRTIEAVERCRMKANISRSIVSFDEGEDPAKSSRFIESKELFEHYHLAGGGRIRVDMSLHAEYTNTKRMSRYLADYAKSVGAGIQIHLSETKKEHDECIARHGMTPTEFFEEAGVLDSPVTAAHCVWITDSDAEILARHNASIAHNPTSNLKLGSGVMDLSQAEAHGINVCLGTDGTASNNTLSILKELQLAAILHKGIKRAPEKHPAAEFIEMATRNGALSQGRQDAGRIESGFRADIILLSLDSVNNIPLYSPEHTVVYSAENSDVCLTMADGEILYENGEYKTIDIEKTIYDMRNACEHYFD